MRSGFLILILLFLITGSADGMDVLLGTVLSVEQESGKVVLEIIQGSDEADCEESSAPKEITINIDPDRLPSCVTAGRMIRIWGDYVKGDVNQFNVLHISGGGGQNQNTDPTGVRSRIGRGMGMGGFKGGMGGKGRRH